MTIILVKTHKLYIIKKRSNNKVSFVEFIYLEVMALQQLSELNYFWMLRRNKTQQLRNL